MSLPLDAALAQCTRHAAVMESALAAMPAPLTVGHMTQADPEMVRLIDQFVLRFTKLQDTLGAHVLRQFARRPRAAGGGTDCCANGST